MDETENGMNEELPGLTPVGEQLRLAREEKGLSVEELARQSRIPQRHLESLEAGNWSKLPATTYTVGFAKTYADAVGLDRTTIADQVREEMGGWESPTAHVGQYEVVDASSGMPRWVIAAAAIAVIGAVLLFSWLNERALVAEEEAAEAITAAGESAPPPVEEEEVPAITADTPVTLVAARAVWLRVTDGSRTLFSGEMAAGDEYDVPADAAAPLLETARPASLTARIDGRDFGFEGEDGRRVRDVSLLAPDIAGTSEGTPAAETTTASTAATTTAPAARPAPAPAPRRALVRAVRPAPQPETTTPPPPPPPPTQQQVPPPPQPQPRAQPAQPTAGEPEAEPPPPPPIEGDDGEA
ncbi:helix-turn-helix domain-containing protein [Sphingomicrobium aestuariivivum]|uniref:helix-turn-helix domain-containing protein n=1 Tax=Sphingomicrobium aestuariivivum TaxID=1582356 RepID=UPI001FD6438C|nr:RodZ domain-containing protein [Sphingomicrobium aestuariivivum]MCJ8190792.1 helix-turn-helix domain-containing protein [Sphingomicrobium aestuariivivum]